MGSGHSASKTRTTYLPVTGHNFLNVCYFSDEVTVSGSNPFKTVSVVASISRELFAQRHQLILNSGFVSPETVNNPSLEEPGRPYAAM